MAVPNKENGVPVECEGGQFAAPTAGGGGSVKGARDSDGVSLARGGSGGAPMNSEMSAPDAEAAWEAYYVWASEQCWGANCPLTPAEQFGAYVSKLEELGLPVVGPHATP